MKQFISFVRKEFYHIFRDARTTMILLLMPVILIILFGYAITTEIKRVPIAIFDQSRDELTLKMADRLNASEYFELYTTVDSYEDAEALFRQGKVHVIVVFPPSIRFHGRCPSTSLGGRYRSERGDSANRLLFGDHRGAVERRVGG